MLFTSFLWHCSVFFLLQIGISHQRRSIQECEHDNEKDRECLMQKTREILPHREFRDACLALENSDAEEMMHVMQSVSASFKSLLC